MGEVYSWAYDNNLKNAEKQIKSNDVDGKKLLGASREQLKLWGFKNKDNVLLRIQVLKSRIYTAWLHRHQEWAKNLETTTADIFQKHKVTAKKMLNVTLAELQKWRVQNPQKVLTKIQELKKCMLVPRT